jgi:hypothetical protein
MAFYGFGYFESQKIPSREIKKLKQAIPILKARDRLADLPIYNFINFKKEGRAKILKQLNKVAWPTEETVKKISSFKDLARMLRG